MDITSAVPLVSVYKLLDQKPDHVEATYGDDGQVRAVAWGYGADDSLQNLARRRGGVWNGGWTFPDDPAAAQVLFGAVREKHPGWMVIGAPAPDQRFLGGVRFARASLPGGREACFFPAPLPYFPSATEPSEVQCFQLMGKGRDKKFGLLVGRADQVYEFVKRMLDQNAKQDDSLLARCGISTTSIPLRVEVNGWAVEIAYNLNNPLHLLLGLLAKDPKFVRKQGERVAVPWHGAINTTRKLWPRWKKKIEEAGLSWGGDDPEADLVLPAAFNEARVPGWGTPAANGHLLHEYQKQGAKFCATRNMRALIGDEMGVGKTAQAIAAAEAVGAPKVFVICPPNARYVWDREIKGWGAGGTIQHITNQLDTLDPAARWHIATYDQLVARAASWILQSAPEKKAFLDAFPARKKDIVGNEYPCKILLETASDLVPDFPDPKRRAAWQKVMRRLNSELLMQIMAAGHAGQILVILDEAHRVKNREAKRTKAILKLAEGEAQMLLLTGTPLRNNEHEAAGLLGILDAEANAALSKAKGYKVQDVKDYLSYFMIRRTKAEVLPELPPKTRQQIDLDQLDEGSLETYKDALASAYEAFFTALKSGASEVEARQKMRGGIEKARTALGLAKVRGGEVADLVVDIVEGKGCCVVFCAHHDVSDELAKQLTNRKIKSAVIDSRTSQKDRARLVQEFQAGQLDVFIGGINSAGEAITLTRADTVIFVELDFVPAALLQAEDRIHRVGQASNCHIVHLIARTAGENLDQIMIEVLGSKLDRIGLVLDEDRSNIIGSGRGGEGSIQAQVLARLLPSGNSIAADTDTVAPAQPQPVEVSVSDPSDSVEPTPKLAPSAPSAISIPIPALPKRGRGRPKVYADGPAPSATERSKKSVQALAAAGGKRIMLRLSPEAHAALKSGMALAGKVQETDAINQAVMVWSQALASEEAEVT